MKQDELRYVMATKAPLYKPKSVIRDLGGQSVMNYYLLLKKIYYFTHYNCFISCVF